MSSQLFMGHVEHARYAPVPHRFRYSIYVYGLDLSELPRLDGALPLFGHNRFRPASIHDADYLDGSNRPIGEKLRSHLEAAGCSPAAGRIILVTSARWFHHVFNPVSFYFVLGSGGEPLCHVAEVNNTFGERHLYILTEPLSPTGHYPVRYTAPKSFHVSPFNNMEGTYEFHFGDITKALDVSVRLQREAKTVFEAQLRGDPLDLTPLNQLRVFLRHPLIPHLTMPRILWQAARLYFVSKLPVNAKPVPMSPMTIKRTMPSFLEKRFMEVVCSLLSRIRQGALRVVLPEGREMLFGEPLPHPGGTLKVHDYKFFRRVAFGGEIGLGESYMAGEWDSPSVTDLFKLFITNRDALREGSRLLPIAMSFLDGLRHIARENSHFGSRRNIREHYDLSNDFFRLFLDETMTYSCGIYRTGQETLEEAQRNKLQAIIRKARIGPGDHVLELGCGWGAFALEAVREMGCRVTGITISREQYQLARQRVAEAGLEDRITILLKDYRHAEGRFDKIVSIEMLEAVGHQYFGEFFRCCERLLAPEGIAALQTITVPDHRYDEYRRGCDWIQKHIFPGGHLPSLGALCDAMARSSRFVVEHVENIGIHYARTLREWRERLERNLDRMAPMGFDRTFQRKWMYYLSFCEAAFETRSLGDMHIVLTRPHNLSLDARG